MKITTENIENCFALLDSVDIQDSALGEFKARCYQNPTAIIEASYAERIVFFNLLQENLDQGFEVVLSAHYHNKWTKRTDANTDGQAEQSQQNGQQQSQQSQQHGKKLWTLFLKRWQHDLVVSLLCGWGGNFHDFTI